MAWHTFGAGMVEAIAEALGAEDYTVDPVEVTAGEASAECAANVGVLAWISAIEEEPDPSNCVWIPPVLWTVRVVACLEPLDAEAWNGILEMAWCAVTDYVTACSAAGTFPCEAVRFRGMNVLQPSGNMIHADYVWRVEEGCGVDEDD